MATYDPVLRMGYAFTHAPDALVVDVDVKPGGGVPRHRHPTLTERWEVLEGTATFTVGRRRQEAGPGTALDVPPGLAHAFTNRTDAPLRLRATVSPPLETEAFLRAAADIHEQGLLTQRGVPTSWRGLVAAAAFARRFKDTIVLLNPTLPPPRLQGVLLGPIARLHKG